MMCCKLYIYRIVGKKLKYVDLLIFNNPNDCRKMIALLDFPPLPNKPKRGQTYYSWG